ncbi:MAG: putative permease [Mariniblastus sp.]
MKAVDSIGIGDNELLISRMVFGLQPTFDMQILNSLVPIFAVIGLGMILRSKNWLTQETTQAFNRFAYYFALPLFLFYKLGGAPTGTGLANRFMVTLFGASVATAIVGWGVAAVFKTKHSSRGALIQAGFRGNLAFIGLPLVLFATAGLAAEQRIQIQSAVLVALSPVVIFYNTASVAVLAVYNEQTEARFSWRSIGYNMITNPLLLACLAGISVQLLGWRIPIAIERTCEVLGASAFPMALVGIGSQLASISVRGHWGSSLLATALKNVFCPLVGWLIGRAMGLEGIELTVILILCAVPTAVSSCVLAEQMRSDPDLAASSLVIATACSLITLSILLALPL